MPWLAPCSTHSSDLSPPIWPRMAAYLAAAGDPQGFDRTPFLVAIDSSAPKGETWATYVEAHATDPQPAYDAQLRHGHRHPRRTRAAMFT